MKAILKNYRQSPRKVRLVADLIKNRSVVDAAVILKTLPKRAAEPMAKLLNSAVANAKATGEDLKDLVVANITVNQGVVLKRMMPRAFGRAYQIKNRTSHVLINLKKVEKKAEKVEKVEKSEKTKTETAKVEKIKSEKVKKAKKK